MRIDDLQCLGVRDRKMVRCNTDDRACYEMTQVERVVRRLSGGAIQDPKDINIPYLRCASCTSSERWAPLDTHVNHISLNFAMKGPGYARSPCESQSQGTKWKAKKVPGTAKATIWRSSLS